MTWVKKRNLLVSQAPKSKAREGIAQLSKMKDLWSARTSLLHMMAGIIMRKQLIQLLQLQVQAVKMWLELSNRWCRAVAKDSLIRWKWIITQIRPRVQDLVTLIHSELLIINQSFQVLNKPKSKNNQLNNYHQQSNKRDLNTQIAIQIFWDTSMEILEVAQSKLHKNLEHLIQLILVELIITIVIKSSTFPIRPTYQRIKLFAQAQLLRISTRVLNPKIHIWIHHITPIKMDMEQDQRPINRVMDTLKAEIIVWLKMKTLRITPILRQSSEAHLLEQEISNTDSSRKFLINQNGSSELVRKFFEIARFSSKILINSKIY